MGQIGLYLLYSSMFCWAIQYNDEQYYRNNHSINCTVTAVIAPLQELLHFFLLKPLKSNFHQFLEEASTGQCVEAIPLGPYTLHTDQFMPPLEIGKKIRFERFEENELDHCYTSLYCTTLYYNVLYYTLLYYTVLHSTIYRSAARCEKYFYQVWQ